MLYQDFAPAIQSVYSSDPQAFQWNLYTEGWSKGAAQRYDDADHQLHERAVGRQHARLARVGVLAVPGSEDGRARPEAVPRPVRQPGRAQRHLPPDDADGPRRVRPHLARHGASTASRPRPTSRTPPSTWSAGPRSPWTLRSASVPGKTDLTVGHLWVWTERTTWNPIGGFGDVYSSDHLAQLYDPPIANHPFTGHAAAVPGELRRRDRRVRPASWTCPPMP